MTTSPMASKPMIAPEPSPRPANCRKWVMSSTPSSWPPPCCHAEADGVTHAGRASRAPQHPTHACGPLPTHHCIETVLAFVNRSRSFGVLPEPASPQSQEALGIAVQPALDHLVLERQGAGFFPPSLAWDPHLG